MRGDSEFAVPGSQEATAEAKKLGLSVVIPAPNQLQIDIDDAVSYNVFTRNLGLLKQYWGVGHKSERTSKSGNPERRHITITLNRDVTPLERIGLQAVLGSDVKREMFSLIRVLEKDAAPTLFFEKAKEDAANA